MKIALITDTHFGCRNDHIGFANFQKKFYAEVFWPTLESRNISTVIHLGDAFDRRKFINFNSLKSSYEMFFEPALERDVRVHMIVGNHDAYFRNTLDINSINLIAEKFNNVTAYPDPTQIEVGGCEIVLMPWICHSNEEAAFDLAEGTKAQVLFGHLELAGYEMYKGGFIHHGHTDDWLRKFDLVCSGHYHHRSTRGNINYLGCPYEMTWSDYDDQKGFHVFDTETRELEFVENPFRMFYKIWYNDGKINVDHKYNDPDDYDMFKLGMIKVIMQDKSNIAQFDVFMSRLEEVNPLGIQVVDDHLNLYLEDDSDIVSEIEDTATILEKYVQSLGNVSKERQQKLIPLLHDLYNEALSIT